MQREMKEADRVKVANRLTLKQEDYLDYPKGPCIIMWVLISGRGIQKGQCLSDGV